MTALSSPVALPFDILYLICEQIYTAGRQQDLATFSLASLTCNAAATPWLYRSVNLDFSTCHSLSTFAFRNPDGFPRHAFVRDLCVTGYDSQGSRAIVAELTELICSMPNLGRFSWKAPSSIPSSLRCILQSHPRVKDVLSESNTMWEESDLSELKDGQPRFALTPCGYDCLRIKSVLDNVAKREDLCFSRYEFPPTSASFDGIDFSTLNSLQLSNCANIGFVFESLLCNVSRLKLKSLTIDQPISFGASGRHKLERFLKTYVGLEEVAFSNLGQSRQCMRTISAQSATLKVLKLHEPGVNGSNKHYVPWRVADADIIATRREHLQDVENVANICRTCPRLCCLVVDQQCVNLDVIDT